MCLKYARNNIKIAVILLIVTISVTLQTDQFLYLLYSAHTDVKSIPLNKLLRHRQVWCNVFVPNPFFYLIDLEFLCLHRQMELKRQG
jgi:hypothetical protein